LGHGSEAAGRIVCWHWIRFFIKGMNRHLFCCETKWVATVRGFADQEESNPADSKVSHAQPP
jgi:hypothetical protein